MEATKGGAAKAINPRTRKRKLPRTTAVLITCQDGEYARRLKEAREKINLAEFGIDGLTLRVAMNGGCMLEIAEGDKVKKVDRLAAKLRATLESDRMKITRPSKTI